GLKWKKAPRFNGHMLGREAGVQAEDGYYRVSVKRQKLSTHRVIWFLTNGSWPFCIDHIDGNKANNSAENLRSVTLSENQHNRICEGVKHDARRDVFCARITVSGKCIELGYFESHSEASEAYKAAKRKLHPSAPQRCYQ
ncbi:HNH endonuclease signature motif containing protein, partial [Serratia fonticola]